MTVKTVGLNLAKDVFQVHGISENGRVIFNKSIIWAMLTKKQEYRQPAF
jgi:transposase